MRRMPGVWPHTSAAGSRERHMQAVMMLPYTYPNAAPSDRSLFHLSGGSTVLQLVQESGDGSRIRLNRQTAS